MSLLIKRHIIWRHRRDKVEGRRGDEVEVAGQGGDEVEVGGWGGHEVDPSFMSVSPPPPTLSSALRPAANAA